MEQETWDRLKIGTIVGFYHRYTQELDWVCVKVGKTQVMTLWNEPNFLYTDEAGCIEDVVLDLEQYKKLPKRYQEMYMVGE